MRTAICRWTIQSSQRTGREGVQLGDAAKYRRWLKKSHPMPAHRVCPPPTKCILISGCRMNRPHATKRKEKSCAYRNAVRFVQKGHVVQTRTTHRSDVTGRSPHEARNLGRGVACSNDLRSSTHHLPGASVRDIRTPNTMQDHAMDVQRRSKGRGKVRRGGRERAASGEGMGC
jgi:hypothetical protein